MAKVIGCSISCAIWLALEAAFSPHSKSRELYLKDDLQLMKKGNLSVSEYGRQFKSLCDQLAAIGHPVDDTDKAHWFLRGLGSSFSSFFAAQMALTPLPTFRDLLSKADSFSLFQESLESSSTSSVVFYSQHQTSGQSSYQSGSSNSSSGSGNGGGNQNQNSRGRGRGSNNNDNCCPPRCQIYRPEGHYADCCPERYTQ